MVPCVGRVIVVSDSHLSERAPESDVNWAAVAEYIQVTKPDLVLHLGDLSLDGTHDQGDLTFARSRLDRLAVPWLAVPGNHDVGDNPGGSDHGMISEERRQQWLDTIGADRWSAEAGGWRLVGVNAQLFGSGMAAEAEQWAFLESETQEAAGPVALVLHKPVTAAPAERAAAPTYRFVPASAQERLGGLPVDLVLSGHVHQYREHEFGGVARLWAPTCWAVIPEHAQPSVGVRRSGILALEFGTDDSDADNDTVRHEFIEPEGLRQLTITVDFPDRYAHR